MKTHRTDGLSLTFGLIFLAIVAWRLVAGAYNVDVPNVGWFVAGALIVLGLLGLVGALRSARPAGPPDEGTAGPRTADSATTDELPTNGGD